MTTGRAAGGFITLWLTVIGTFIGWTWAMYRLFQEREPVTGAVVGLALPAVVAVVSVLAWATNEGEGAG